MGQGNCCWPISCSVGGADCYWPSRALSVLVADPVGTHDNTRNFVPSKTFTCFETGLPFDERRVGVLLASDHDDVCKTIKPLRPPKSVVLAGIPNFDANG
jgi:hypothetical protein